ncbi:hypothetical protein ABZU78_08750 [Rhodococcus erythropolis]|nr:hypothetical protein [Rhodococcus sp. IEGM 1406]MDI9907608.1 hypothetical protein [Rhodococcus sp. IEGM 1406]
MRALMWHGARLMGVFGLECARRGMTKRTAIADPQVHRADDLVQ